MKKNNLAVLKLGGSVLEDLASFDKNATKILEIIYNFQKKYEKLILVLSAFKGETQKLQIINEKLFPNNIEYKDYVLSRGELFSTNIIFRYLKQKNLNVEICNENDFPILTDDNFSKAKIIKINTRKIKNLLTNSNILLVPGFIGKNKKSKITTLGLNGSDITAVSIASHMKIKECFLLKDVNGIFSADPFKVKNAKTIKEISYDDAYSYCLLGAKILHPLAIKLAKKNQITLHILKNNLNKKSTIKKIDGRTFKAVTYLKNQKNEIILSVFGKVNKEKFLSLLQKEKIDFLKVKQLKTKRILYFSLLEKEKLNFVLNLAHDYLNLKKEN
ncbi:MAG: hypothetical protein PHI50_00550 [Alphaproteobacteria bacterium]|nr:hypothetical protein [Alphaproteobacteria bacterium]